MIFAAVIELIFKGSNDLASFFWPQAYFIKTSILTYKTLPLWQPMFFSGMPLLGDPQNLWLYPPNFLFLLLPLDWAFLGLFFSHLVFAGITTFLLVKKIFKKSSLAAMVAALSFILAPKTLSHLEAGHYTMVVALSWLPLFFWLSLDFIKKASFKKTVILSIILTIFFFNYVNIFYFAFLFFMLLLIVEKPRLIKFLPLIVTLFLGLSSFQLLPSWQLGNLSNRSNLTFEDVAQPLWSFRLFCQSLFFPYLYGLENFGTENLLFPGLLVGFLSIFGFFSLKTKRRLLFGLWLIFSILYSLGARTPFFGFFYRYAPLVKFMRITTRLWLISTLLLAILAGLGFDFLLKKVKILKKFSLLLVFLLTLELFFVGYKILRRSPPASFSGDNSRIYQFLKQDHTLFRAYCTTDCLSGAEAVKIGKPLLAGYNPVQLKDYVDFLSGAAGYEYDKYLPILPPYPVFNQKPQPDSERLGLVNAKYVFSPYPLKDQGFVLEEKIGEIFVYQNLRAIGQVFLERGEERIPLPVKEYLPNRISIELDPEFEGRLILSEIFYPGWQVFVDGKESKLFKTHEILRGVDIKKGSKEAVLVFKPKYFYLGLGISCLTLAIIGMIFKKKIRLR